MSALEKPVLETAKTCETGNDTRKRSDTVRRLSDPGIQGHKIGDATKKDITCRGCPDETLK